MKVCQVFKNCRYMQYLSAIVATISIASATTYVTWAALYIPILTSEDSPIGKPLTDVEASWLASSILLGTIVGTIVCGLIADKFGRRTTMLSCAIPLFVPWIVIAFTKSIIVLIIARFLAGVTASVVVMSAVMYNGEIAEKDIRGKLGLACNLLMGIGSLFIFTVGPFVTYKTLALSCSAFPLVFVVLFYFMPESPYYLVKIGQIDAARNNLSRLSKRCDDEKIIDKRLEEIEKTVFCDMQHNGSLIELLKPDYRKALVIAFGLKTLQQFSGLMAIDAYSLTIIQASDSNISYETSSIIIGSIQIPSYLIAGALVDRIGRKPLLIISAVGCTLTLIGEGIYFYLQVVVEADVENLAWLPVTGVALYMVMNTMGMYSMPYVLTGELFAMNIKGVAISVNAFYGTVLSFITVRTFNPIVNAWGMYSVFWIYAAVCILGTIFVIFIVPETKGKTFAEIQGKLNQNRKDCNNIGDDEVNT